MPNKPEKEQDQWGAGKELKITAEINETKTEKSMKQIVLWKDQQIDKLNYTNKKRRYKERKPEPKD